MQPMSSMQTSLLPGVTPGWNDPPPLGNPGSGSRLNRYRRVVDPSLSAAGGSPAPYAASPQQGMPPQGIPPMQQIQYAQYHQPQQYAQPDYSIPGRATVHPQGAGDQDLQQQQQQHLQLNPIQQQPLPQQIQPPPQYPTDPSASANAVLYPMSPYNSLHQQYQQQHQQGTMTTTVINHPADYDQMNAQAAAEAERMRKEAEDRERQRQHAEYYSTQPAPQSLPSNNVLAMDSKQYKFIAPNAVPSGDNAHDGGVVFVDRATYVPPMKAPGDVSLPPEKLHAFIVKAAMSLHDEKSKGVQLKVWGLLADIGHLTKDDPFIKKFNYVIDAIDRSSLAEAVEHFNQLQTQFPDHIRNLDNNQEKPWVGGIRFLLQEMKNRHPLG